MTTEYLITLLVTLLSMAALDYLLLLARRKTSHLSAEHTLRPFRQQITAWLQQIQNKLFSFWKRVSQEPPTQPDGLDSQEQARASEMSSPLTTTGSQITAEYEIPAGQNVAHIRIQAEIPPQSVLHITISTDKQGRASIGHKTWKLPSPNLYPLKRLPLPNLQSGLHSLLAMPAEKLAVWLFGFALCTYLLTRLIGLTDFPIYFFGDEAIQTTTAADLIRDGLRGPRGIFLPTYFQNGLYFNLSTSVYLQVIPYLLFGKSIFVTRATSVLITLLAAVSVGLILRDFLGAKRWWLGTLLLSIVPAWFLHSRTAFETVLFVSFYAAFLYFYLVYRLRNPQQVYWAVVFAGLAFYSYSPGQLVLAVTGILLFLNDLPYHWKQRETLLKALGILALFALPYLRFRLTVEYAPLDHLRSLGSYWVQPTPLSDKLARFISEYLRGLSPSYWFFDSPDMARHQMRGYGHISLWFAPFLLTGLCLALWRRRSSASRVVLLAALASPAGAALAEIGITRALVFVIPVSVLAALGMDGMLTAVESLSKRLEPKPLSQNLLSLLVFVPLVSLNLAMLTDALRNGPTWYTDYGLYGMQYGAKQIYQDTVVPTLQKDPQARFYITPSWANGAEHFVSFFVPREFQSRVALGQVYDFIRPESPFSEHDYFVATWLEFEKIKADPKFTQITIHTTIPYPNGEIGFYVFTARLSENIRQLLAEEDLQRRTPVEQTVEWMGQSVRIRHSQLSGGRLQDVLDGDPETLARGERANPILYEFFFSQPINATELILTTGSMRDFDVLVLVYPLGEKNPVEYSINYKDLPDDPTVTIRFENGPAQFDHIVLFIKDNNQGEIAQVHVREIQFR
ncbi:MAG: hypothetical protein DDG60_11170 [Anaerolineae bacterium]|nr:MAG: hypothetical protein DDG60_11170 [Anaerolineae bacterium]